MYRPHSHGKDKPPPRGAIVCLPQRPKSDDGLPDILWYKQALNRLGYYRPDPAVGIDDDEGDPAYRDALYAFQRAASVPFGDASGNGSVTERKLTEALEDVGASERYIWRTAGDGKVRHEHALRDGRIYSWNDPPEGDEHPGDDHNCRCWAEPLNPSRHPWAAWSREQAENRELLKNPYIQNINAAALVFEGAVISVEVCLRNGRCRTWLMEQAAKYVLENTYHLPPKTLPAFPDAKKLDKFKGRRRWIDSKGRIYEWDYKKGEVEIYDKTGKKHLGGFDPKTGKQRSKPVEGRRIEK